MRSASSFTPQRIALLSLLAFGGWCPLLARGVVVSPTQLGLVGAPGETVSGSILVASSRQETNQIRISVGDFNRDEDGRLVSVEKSVNPRSCRTWIEADRADFTSPETGRVEVIVSAKIPRDASGSYWALLRIDSVPPPRRENQIGLALMPRVAVPLIVTVAGTEKLNVRVVESRAVQPKQGDTIECQSVIENTGNTAVLFSGAFSLERATATSDPEEVGSVSVGPVTSLPGTRMKIKGQIGWKGTSTGLQVHGYFRYGPNREDTAEFATAIEDEATTARPPSPSDRLAPALPLTPSALPTPPPENTKPQSSHRPEGA